MIRTVATAGGALAFGAIVFLSGLRVFFPGDEAVERAQWEVQNASDGEWAFAASDASPWWLSGLTFDDVVVYKVEKPKIKKRRRKRRAMDEEDASADEPEAAAGKAVPFVRADAVSARLGLIPLLGGEKVIHYDLDIFGGALSGRMSQSESSRGIVVKGRDIDMSRVPISGEDFDIEATGEMIVDADLSFDLDDFKKSEGAAHLAIEDLVLTSMSIYGFDMGSATFKEADLELQIGKGEIEIDKGRFESDMFTANLKGGVTISSKVVDRWRLRVEIEAELAPDLDSMLKVLPKMKDARDEDGVYHFLCTGTVSRPYCRVDQSAAGTRPESTRVRGGSGRRVPGSAQPDGKEPDTADGDERRQRRLDRIKERRDRGRLPRDPDERSRIDEPRELGDEFDDADDQDAQFDDEFDDRIPGDDEFNDEDLPPNQFDDRPQFEEPGELPFDPDQDFR